MKTAIFTRLTVLACACMFLLPLVSNTAPREAQVQMASGQSRKLSAAELAKSGPEAPKTCKRGAISEKISCLVERTKNPLLRLLFILLLGILMSFTPCIYPMIPITIGILQSSAQNSLWRSILAALFYTLGIAVTFAVLGLLAATGGAQFGHLLSEPIVIILLVLFLGYFGFAMLGLYELRLPAFMQRGPDGVKSNSLISVFLFGAISGTVASPCLSPGLVLLLSIAATIGSKLIGFLYLFTFGVGLCVPLLIIGFFSNSLSLLPRAGIWMIEVKRIFGVLLIAMCFYYLSPLMHGCLLRGILAGVLATTGLFFFSLANKKQGTGIKWYQRIVGTLLIAAGIYAAVDAIHYWQCPPVDVVRALSYQDAKKQGIAEHKKLLVDFGASWCTTCREIEKNIMHNEKVHAQLPEVIFVEIDGTDPHNTCCAELSKKFSVIGFPTILLLDPESERVLARWGDEFALLPPAEVVAKIRAALSGS